MNKKNILVIAAHPDDEVLGCGGTIARLSAEGHDVHVLILAEGLTSREIKRDRESKQSELNSLSNDANKANFSLGVKTVELFDFPDNRMDSIDRLDVIKVVERKIEEIKPSLLFTHFVNDLNIDHRITNDAVVTACRAYPGQVVEEIYFFEVASSTEWQISPNLGGFQPTVYFRLNAKYMEKKKTALSFYGSEMRKFPHARSIEAVEALGMWRGANIGFEYAEAFMCARLIR
ncbi:PIG-L family deacetylase [Leptospira kanakyensis]|uniref:PIG-L family deacetylase n=1 Tax=Leptospira kanakyensis TaxID=2484968 RepID=A0A6N4QEG6_9LEPT|nr:PIG-L deacetylase family protein [Leptospira kanakyensis]TGK51932.1 PIG-L family deacetylase [Leptospira kanakyensis]TGK57160.1 PIG-L family deacetylase [Leptospira kanakyensis]TGK71824.1 PIG-L family deacetylase [Leptospira kanakyensis]